MSLSVILLPFLFHVYAHRRVTDEEEVLMPGTGDYETGRKVRRSEETE